MVANEPSRLRLGVMAAYIGHRPDILAFVSALEKHVDVVLFVHARDADRYSELLSSVELVRIDVTAQRTLTNKVADRLFDLLGRLPASRYNYYMTRWTTTYSASYSEAERKQLQRRISVSKKLPKTLAYDTYLKSLSTESIPKIQIDAFLSFTPVYNDVVWANMIASPIPCFQYVYSWDHACKFKDFSKRVDTYLTWDRDIAQDLADLQGLERNARVTVGSTQFTYIHDYLASDFSCALPTEGKYIYFGCATGYPLLASSEVQQILVIARRIKEDFPDVTLVVRTYPFLEAGNTYEPLLQCSNVVLDRLQDYQSIATSYRETTDRKLHITRHALAFLHFGTTLGVEAALMGVPSVLCDFGSEALGRPLHDFVHQYQNDKYLNRPGTLSTASGLDNLSKSLAAALNGKGNFPVNDEIRARTELRPMKAIAKAAFAVIDAACHDDESST